MDEIYLDNAASTLIHPKVLEAYSRASSDYYANSSNIKHKSGRDAKNLLEGCRLRIGELLGLDPRGIIFTSGATEANNLALRGVSCLNGSRCLAAISAIEHPCITQSAEMLKSRGVRVKAIPVTDKGIINLKELYSIFRSPNLKFVSVMLVNNETGAIQPIHKVSELAKKTNVIFHTDAVQAIGKVPNKVLRYADMVSISGHKIHGPKGIGLLWIRPRLKLKPIIVGGGQEHGLRSGTIPLPLILALTKAIELAVLEDKWLSRLEKPLRDAEREIISQIPEAKVNGDKVLRVSNISNISFPYHQSMIDSIEGVALSSGSACGCVLNKPSKVLSAMGLPKSHCVNSIRISTGRFNSAKDVAIATKKIISTAKKLR